MIGMRLSPLASALLLAASLAVLPPRPASAGAEVAAPGSAPAAAPSGSRNGHLLLQAGEYAEALRVFEQALEIDPRSPAARAGRGIALARLGRLDEAAAALREALVLHPDPVRVHYELGRVYEELGETGQALAEYKAGLARHERDRRPGSP